MKALLKECREKVERIKAANDDGYYAKMYAEDVTKLLREIDRLDELAERLSRQLDEGEE